jgi:hypothetical protein
MLDKQDLSVEDQIASLQRWLVHEQRELRGFIRRVEPEASVDATKSMEALEAVRLGADGLVLKEAMAQDLLECLETSAPVGGESTRRQRLALSAAVK